MILLRTPRNIQNLYEKIRELHDKGIDKGIVCVDGFHLRELKFLMNKHKANLEFPDLDEPRFKLNFEANGLKIQLKSVEYEIRYYFAKADKKNSGKLQTSFKHL